MFTDHDPPLPLCLPFFFPKRGRDGFTEDMGLYDAVYGAINNAMQVLRDERAAMPESQSAKVAAQRADLDFIQAHLSAKQLDTMYARSMLMVADATERLRATGRKKAKPEDIVHLHETAIQATHDRDELESAHSEDTELRKENAAQVAALKAKRYASHCCNGSRGVCFAWSAVCSSFWFVSWSRAAMLNL